MDERQRSELRGPARIARAVPCIAISALALLGAGSARAYLPPPSCAAPADGLVAWWPGNGNAHDLMDRHHGSFGTYLVYGAGVVGDAFVFPDFSPIPPPSNLIVAADDPELDFGTGDFTVEAWVQTSFLGGTGNDFFVAKAGTGSDIEFVLGYRAAGTGVAGAPLFLIGDAGSASVRSVEGTASIADGAWHHLAGVRQGDQIRLYVDGALVDATGGVAGYDVSGPHPVTLAGREESSNDPYLLGMLDEPALYAAALTGAEIAAIVAAGGQGKCRSAVVDRSLQTYWKYRDALRANYLVVGDCCGCSLPAWNRHNGHIEWGDTTMSLGWYLGVLASELRLLQDAEESTTATAEELYYALSAFNRLDLKAESSWQEFLDTGQVDACDLTPDPSDLNGFFIRMDVPPDVLTDSALTYQGYTMEQHLNSYVPLYSVSDVTSAGTGFDRSNGLGPVEASQDQIVHMLLGLALVSGLVDSSIVANGMPLADEARAITTRIVNWMKGGDWILENPVRDQCVWGVPGCWPPNNPDGPPALNRCICGGAITTGLSFGFASAANKIVWGFTPGVSPLGGFHNPTSMGAEVTWRALDVSGVTFKDVDFYLTLAAIGDSIRSPGGQNITVPELAERSQQEHTEHLPLVHHVLYGGGTGLDRELYDCLVGNAPCGGTGANAPFEWRHGNRFRQGGGSTQVTTAEGHGLDFMLLFNLYNLVWGGTLPSYVDASTPGTFSASPADDEGSVNCSCLAAIDDVVQCTEFCKLTKRECTQDCRTVKGSCKQTCGDTKDTCKEACNSLSTGKERRQCRRQCRQDKRQCKSVCRADGRTCKQTCRAARKECKQVCTTATPAEQVQYCEDIAQP